MLKNPKEAIRAMATGKDTVGFTEGASKDAVLDVQFALKITNAGAAVKTATLCPGLHNSNAEIVTAGITSDGIVDDSEFVTSFLTGAALDDQLTIKHFLSYLKEYRFLVTDITLQTNDTAQYDQKFYLTPSNPFENEGRKTIPINKYFSEYQNNETKINMRLGQYNERFELSNLSVLTLPVVASSVLYITFYGKAIIRS